MPEDRRCQLILALDVPTREEALALLDRLDGSVQWIKVGLQLFTAYGPDFVRQVADRGHRVFLDLKLHDIPNTVAKAVQSIAALPVEMLTLHAAGGTEMIRWAEEARAEHAPHLHLLGVTVLTSMNDQQLREINVQAPAEAQVLHLARMACQAGIQGLVCSPLEITPVRQTIGSDPILVTPGIRPAGSASDEQKRILTPAQAAAAGSDYIVVGRPILKAPDPAAAAHAIRAELT
ncbi:MAG: orotidine-5'-phosphate decarboxylase [Coraliomargaritaceae bacterium]